mmetsp:Transcript_134633/g.288085  ORF Transcript_134633/g.288085 Transcript_134633/m.288085 type:complete len:228 (-) Transcript_134633:60-743(-)
MTRSCCASLSMSSCLCNLATTFAQSLSFSSFLPSVCPVGFLVSATAAARLAAAPATIVSFRAFLGEPLPLALPASAPGVAAAALLCRCRFRAPFSNLLALSLSPLFLPSLASPLASPVLASPVLASPLLVSPLLYFPFLAFLLAPSSSFVSETFASEAFPATSGGFAAVPEALAGGASSLFSTLLVKARAASSSVSKTPKTPLAPKTLASHCPVACLSDTPRYIDDP